MQVSVIIPVFNTERFVAAAVESALAQPETGEVLLIDDGSTDKSFEICQGLASDQRVRLLTHPDKINKGAAATRNLGIDNATMPFVAFLDADDLYLPGRFEIAKRIFNEHPDADGVHEIIGVHYYDPSLKDQRQWQAAGENTGISIQTSPEHLFRTLASGKFGHISLDGLVIKKDSVGNDLRFDSTFVMSEDSDFILRLAASRRLYGGDLSRVVTLRGVHGQNSVFVNPKIMYYRRLYLQKCIDHRFYGSKDLMAQLYILTRRVGAGNFYAPFRRLGKIALPIKLLGIAGYLFVRPGLLAQLTRLSWKR